MTRVAKWVENEIQCNIDGYGNTDAQAAEFVLDLLSEGEYEDQGIARKDRPAAVLYLRNRKGSK